MPTIKLLKNIIYRLGKYTQILRKYIKRIKAILSCKHYIPMLLCNIKETTILEIKLCSHFFECQNSGTNITSHQVNQIRIKLIPHKIVF